VPILTYQGERQRDAVETVGGSCPPPRSSCDVGDDRELAQLAEKLGESPGRIDAVVHSIAFANRDDMTRPFVETSRAGFTLAQDISAYEHFLPEFLLFGLGALSVIEIRAGGSQCLPLNLGTRSSTQGAGTGDRRVVRATSASGAL